MKRIFLTYFGLFFKLKAKNLLLRQRRENFRIFFHENLMNKYLILWRRDKQLYKAEDVFTARNHDTRFMIAQWISNKPTDPRGMGSIPRRVKTFCYEMLLLDIWVFKFRWLAEHSLSFVCKNTYVFIFISALYSCLSLLHKNHHGIVGCIHKYILYYIDHERFRSVKGRLFGWQLPKMAENCWLADLVDAIFWK